MNDESGSQLPDANDLILQPESLESASPVSDSFEATLLEPAYLEEVEPLEAAPVREAPPTQGARITSLRIAGFKSFADAVSVDILPGLTGIVGPNGCGKSNVVEALRWAMGETSAKSLRGGEMDDVIFAGTAARNSRNLAEVTISLDGALPAPFGNLSELQVTRRIERGSGSSYRASGAEIRARDVQTFFADLASGARSSGMVSQGRISTLVSAKPEERRQVLEEAAGITGLRARRHEADLKLRAAETNLSRSQDLLGQLENTREALRKQAREAKRYRNMSGMVGSAEAEYLAIQYTRAQNAFAQTAAQMQAAELEVKRCSALSLEASARVEAAEAAIPAPRAREAQSRSALERKRIETEQLQEAQARADAALLDAQLRADQLQIDLVAAGARLDDAAGALQEAEAEAQNLKQRVAAVPSLRDSLQAECALGEQEVQEAAITAQQAAENAAHAKAEARAARTAHEKAQEQESLCLSALSAAQSQIEQAEQSLVAASEIEHAQHTLDAARETLAAAREAFTSAQSARQSAELAAGNAQNHAQNQRNAHEAAHSALARALTRAQSLAGELAQSEERAQFAISARIAPELIQNARAATHDAQNALREAQTGEAQAASLAHQSADQAAHARREAEDLRAAIARADAALHAALERVNAETASYDRQKIAFDRASTALIAEETLAAAQQNLHTHQKSFESALSKIEAASTRLVAAQCARAQSAACESAARENLGSTRAQADGIGSALAALGGEHSDQNLLEILSVPAGLEAAFGAALLGVATASLDPNAPSRFTTLPALPSIPPAGTTPLSNLIAAPEALSRLFAFTLLLSDDAAGDEIQTHLAPGQMVVSRDGKLWRWDGFCSHENTAGAAAQHLKLRNQLAALTEKIAGLEIEHQQAALDLTALQSQESTHLQQRDAALANHHAAQTALMQAQAAATSLEAEAQSLIQAATMAAQSLDRATSARDAALALAQEAQATRQNFADTTSGAEQASAFAQAAQAAQAAHQHQRETLTKTRADLAQAERTLAALITQDEEALAAINVLAPQLERLRAEHRASLDAHTSATEALEATPDPTAATIAAQQAREQASIARQQEVEAQTTAQAAEAALESSRQNFAQLTTRQLSAQSRFDAAHANHERCLQNLAAAQTQLEESRKTLATLPDETETTEQAERAQIALAACQAQLAHSQRANVALESELHAATQRIQSLSLSIAAWQERAQSAQSARDDLAQRHTSAQSESENLERAPAEITIRMTRSAEILAEAEAQHAQIASALTAAEDAQRLALVTEREADLTYAQSRENLARCQGAQETAHANVSAVLARIAEKCGEDAALPEIEDATEASEEKARKKLDRLLRERDEMGPVNLRAELELEELEARIGTIGIEREEVTTAIAKLRGAIGSLNREGRERLSAVFTEVDRHFRALFTRVMGGGRAHLALVGSDDPLEAGLEIYAEPPGKKLSTLSLLSGGEQALTALSLIFAVFRCMPAPISVLDEVDAPLDDANVERFCTLLEDVSRDTGTRFLVVTHHQLTMSRMDRLYGVTMQERGISRVLSVDLQKAAEMINADGEAVAA